MAGMRGLTIVAIVALASIATSPVLAVVTLSPDGRPRPDGYPDTPTINYGPTPPCYLNSVAVTCDWYGFSHVLYPVMGAACLAETRKVLANTTLVPPGDLEPYQYYYLKPYVFDTTTNASYCLYGCFDMSAAGPVASPPLGFAPPPVDLSTPPPVVFAPPPVDLSTPPPVVFAPPPVDLSTPPPMPFTPPPVADAPPPSLIAPSTDPSASPPDLFTAPPAAVPPAPSLPLPPPHGSIINLNGAGFLRPTGLVSFIISGALLVLNGLVAF